MKAILSAIGFLFLAVFFVPALCFITRRWLTADGRFTFDSCD